jgi:hypothetical protein
MKKKFLRGTYLVGFSMSPIIDRWTPYITWGAPFWVFADYKAEDGSLTRLYKSTIPSSVYERCLTCLPLSYRNDHSGSIFPLTEKQKDRLLKKVNAFCEIAKEHVEQ